MKQDFNRTFNNFIIEKFNYLRFGGLPHLRKEGKESNTLAQST